MNIQPHVPIESDTESLPINKQGRVGDNPAIRLDALAERGPSVAPDLISEDDDKMRQHSLFVKQVQLATPHLGTFGE